MRNGLHFISGLPRSGSTLLAAILRQNPGLHAEMSGPMGQMFAQLQSAMSGRNEFHSFISDAQRVRVLKGVFDAFYADVAETKVIFDTNRMWTSRMMVLRKLFPQARVVCCVRLLPWVFDSFERLTRINALEPSGLFNFEAKGSVYDRVEQLSGPKGVVGSAFQGLKDAFYTSPGPDARHLVLLPYEALVSRPDHAIAQLYDFLGLAPFEHDFADVRYEADHYDSRMGARGLHQVSGPVAHRQRPILLPPDLIAKFRDTAFWLDPSRNPHGVRVIGVNDPPAAEAKAPLAADEVAA